MKKTIFVILALSLLIISGCGEDKIIEDLNKQIAEKDNIILELREQNANLTLSRNKVTQPTTTIETKPTTSHIDTSAWNSNDFVTAMATASKKFVNNNWVRYQYNTNGAYYYMDVSVLFGVDSFYNLTYDQDNQELNTSKLRIFGLGFGDSVKGLEKYNPYVSKIDKVDLLSDTISCTKTSECGEIKVIKCVTSDKDSNTFTSWFDGNYVFEIRDDTEGLTAFKQFYCK